MPVTKKLESVESNRIRGGHHTCEFDQINAPGLYVSHQNGTLFRIPDDAVVSGRSPVMEIVSGQPWIVTKISDDPFLPVTKARMIAADLDLFVNF